MVQKLTHLIRNIQWKSVFSYFGLFAIFFFVFLYITFPYDAVKNAVVAQIESKAPVSVQIDKFSPYRMTGFEVQNVMITNDLDKSQVYFQVDKARVRMHILPFLSGKLKADYDLYGMGGGVAGQMILKGSEFAIAANFKGLDIARAGADKQLKQFGEVRINGTMDGKMELYLNSEDKKASQGMVRFEYRNLRMMNSTILQNKLPDILFKDPAVVQFSLKNRNMTIDEWNLSSENLEVKASGRITLREKIENSRFNMKFSVKPSEAIEDSFGAFVMVLPEPDNDGFYNFTFSGTAKNPKFKKR